MNYFKADGGRIGFVEGGALDRSTLNERGQAVYDAMKASNQPDQSIIDQLNVLGLYNTGTDTGIASIVNVQPNIIDQGGGGGGGPLGTQISDFRAAIPQQIPAVNPADAGWYVATDQEIPTMTETKEPGKLESFIGSGINKLRESKLGQMAGSALGWLGDLPGAGIVTGRVDKMDRFDELPAGDQAFIESMMGYSDPDTNRGNVDPFGINTRSLFGNYADYVKKRNAMYEASGKTYRPGSWQAQNQQFYQAQENERIRQEKEAAEKQAALRQQVQQQAQINRQRGEGGWGTSLGHEGNVGFMTDVAEMGSFKKGGLATMFERRR